MNQDNQAQGIASVEPSVWRGMLRTMLLARYSEERLIRLYHQGRIFGGVYTGIGQEGIGAAAAAAGGPDDLYTPAIRDAAVHVGRGTPVVDMFRQYLGRVTGPTRGRDGNVHHGNLACGVIGMISHLGSMLPVLVGAVMARRRRGLAAVGFGFSGDGATSTGDFHEALNFAAVFDVPVVFIVENNHYAYSTPTRLQFRCEKLSDRARGYGMEGRDWDGNDAVGLYLLLSELVGEIRETPRPVLVVCDTMRMRGHGEHDDASYVPPELLRSYADRDPLSRLRRELVHAGVVVEEEIEALAAVCLEEVNQAYRQALAEPRPSAATLYDGVYADD